jgi:hypothetical protein
VRIHDYCILSQMMQRWSCAEQEAISSRQQAAETWLTNGLLSVFIVAISNGNQLDCLQLLSNNHLLNEPHTDLAVHLDAVADQTLSGSTAQHSMRAWHSEISSQAHVFISDTFPLLTAVCSPDGALHHLTLSCTATYRKIVAAVDAWPRCKRHTEAISRDVTARRPAWGIPVQCDI